MAGAPSRATYTRKVLAEAPNVPLKVAISEILDDEIERWRKSNNLDNKSEAIRLLISRGLCNGPVTEDELPAKAAPSRRRRA